MVGGTKVDRRRTPSHRWDENIAVDGHHVAPQFQLGPTPSLSRRAVKTQAWEWTTLATCSGHTIRPRTPPREDAITTLRSSYRRTAGGWESMSKSRKQEVSSTFAISENTPK